MANNTSMIDAHMTYLWLESTRRMLGIPIDYDDILAQLDGAIPGRIGLAGSGNESSAHKSSADYSIARGWQEELGINV